MLLKKVKLLVLVFIPVLMSCKNNISTEVVKPSAPSVPNCGDGRWSIKTGLDSGASKIRLVSPERSTIAKLISYPSPTQVNLPDDTRIEPLETKVYSVDATLIKFKVDADKGYRLVLKDNSGKIMTANIPEPSCVSKLSPFLEGILDSRKEFDLKFKSNEKFKTTNTPVKISGVGFFGMQSSESPVELFPVISLSFSR